MTQPRLAREIRAHLETSSATADELAELLGTSRAMLRNALCELYFEQGTIVCDASGRYHLRGGATLKDSVAATARGV